MLFNIYQDSVLHLEGELCRGSVYLHCKVFKTFSKAVYRHCMTIFMIAAGKLKPRHSALRALIPADNKKLARFAELFGLQQVQYVAETNNLPAFYIYEVC